MKEVPWLGGPLPRMRLEAHYGDRVIECFAERPRGLFDLFANAVLRNPEGEAVVCGDKRISWRELDQKVTSVAAGLAKRGIKSGDALGSLSATGRNLSSRYLPRLASAQLRFRSASGNSAMRSLML